MNRGSPSFDAIRLADGVSVRLRGRPALTMLLLRFNQEKGVRALQFPGGPAYRLAAYIHTLKKAGFSIRKTMEAHEGGSHAVYFLDDEVQLSLPEAAN